MDRKRAQQVLSRDGWQCQMPACLHPDGRVILRELPRDDPWSASVDHVIPKMFGGSDSEVNLRAAHKKCNNARGTGGIYRDQRGLMVVPVTEPAQPEPVPEDDLEDYPQARWWQYRVC